MTNRSFLQKLLDYFQISYEDYLSLLKEYDLSSFAEGHNFSNISEAILFVKKMMDNKKKILIYGDYDADGIMGTSILKKAFMMLNYYVDFYIPNRYEDGYGINISKAQQYIDNKYDLIITVDNGVTAFEAISLLRDNGVNVLVLDHHQNEDELPNANFIIHPFISNFGDISSSGAFVAFMFASELLGYKDKYLSTLAAISLISDMMPLKSYNRNFLKAVFKDYQIGEFLAVDLLADHEKVDETVIGMKIAPRINSIGRLIDNDSINDIVAYFVSDDKDFILNYFSYIDKVNNERKEISVLSQYDINVNTDESAIIISLDCKEGIIGLIAQNLMNKYKKPVIIFTKSETAGVLKGSGRAPEGFNIVESFNYCKEYILSSGGHALAGGCSIKEENFSLFKSAYLSFMSSHNLNPPIKACIPLLFVDLTFENYQLIKTFSPFGEGWVAPLFRLSRIKTSALTFSRTGEHIITQVGSFSRLVGFGFSKKDVSSYSFVDLYGIFRINSFRGANVLEFFIKEIKESTN